MKKLIKAQKEYIEFLSEKYDDAFKFCHTHGIRATKEDIEKGDILRQKIKYLECGLKL